MSEVDGCVALAQVVAVLRTQTELSISLDGVSLHIVRDGVPWVQNMEDPVPRCMLQYLARRYGVRIEWFFHPEMCVSAHGTRN